MKLYVVNGKEDTFNTVKIIFAENWEGLKRILDNLEIKEGYAYECPVKEGEFTVKQSNEGPHVGEIEQIIE